MLSVIIMLALIFWMLSLIPDCSNLEFLEKETGGKRRNTFFGEK